MAQGQAKNVYSLVEKRKVERASPTPNAFQMGTPSRAKAGLSQGPKLGEEKCMVVNNNVNHTPHNVRKSKNLVFQCSSKHKLAELAMLGGGTMGLSGSRP